MIVNVVEATHARLPILPDDWRKHAPHLCEGCDADYLLLDLGPGGSAPRLTIIGLRSGAYTLHFCKALSEVHADPAEGGLGVASSLLVPLYREHRRHHGHVALLYRERRSFSSADIAHLQEVAERFLSFLGAD